MQKPYREEANVAALLKLLTCQGISFSAAPSFILTIGPDFMLVGKGTNTGKQMQIDVVAESMNGSSILFGEAIWEKLNLSAHAKNFRNIGKQKVVFAAWCKHLSSSTKNTHAFAATDIVTIVKN